MSKVKLFRKKEAKEKLLPITEEDLIFNDGERFDTQLILDDYEWSDYKLITHLNTRNQGHMSILFEFFGSTKSEMIVARTSKDWRSIDLTQEENELACNRDTVRFVYTFPTDVYKKYLMCFTSEHTKQWDKNAPAFYGKQIVLDFYNQVLKVGKASAYYADEDGRFPMDAYPPSMRSMLMK